MPFWSNPKQGCASCNRQPQLDAEQSINLHGPRYSLDQDLSQLVAPAPVVQSGAPSGQPKSHTPPALPNDTALEAIKRTNTIERSSVAESQYKLNRWLATDGKEWLLEKGVTAEAIAGKFLREDGIAGRQTKTLTADFQRWFRETHPEASHWASPTDGIIGERTLRALEQTVSRTQDTNEQLQSTPLKMPQRSMRLEVENSVPTDATPQAPYGVAVPRPYPPQQHIAPYGVAEPRPYKAPPQQPVVPEPHQKLQQQNIHEATYSIDPYSDRRATGQIHQQPLLPKYNIHETTYTIDPYAIRGTGDHVRQWKAQELANALNETIFIYPQQLQPKSSRHDQTYVSQPYAVRREPDHVRQWKAQELANARQTESPQQARDQAAIETLALLNERGTNHRVEPLPRATNHRAIAELDDLQLREFSKRPAGRNNNPGNIKVKESQIGTVPGLVGRDKHGHGIFETPEAGIRYAYDYVSRMMSGNHPAYNKEWSLTKAFDVYSGGNGNSHVEKFLARTEGQYSANTKIKDVRPEHYIDLLPGIFKSEDGKVYTALAERGLLERETLRLIAAGHAARA